MTRFPSFRMIAAAASLGTLAACGGGADDAPIEAAPASDEPAIIGERQANLKGMSDSFKALRTQLEGDAPDFEVIEASAADMNARATVLGTQFPEGTGVDAGFDTEALAIIWEDRAGFETAAQNLVDATAQMVEIAASGDAAAVGEQVKKVGGTCKACHDKFRLDTD